MLPYQPSSAGSLDRPMRFDVRSVSKFLGDPRVNAYGTLFTQQVALVPETVRQTCLQVSIGGLAAPGTIV